MFDKNTFSLNFDEFSRIGHRELFALFEKNHKLIINKEELLKDKDNQLDELKKQVLGLEDKIQMINGQLVILRSKLYGKRSEKNNKDLNKNNSKNPKSKKDRSKRVKSKLSEKYNLPILEQHIELKDPPVCSCCSGLMTDSGMTEDSEFLHIVPAKFMIVRQKRHKYRCGQCHSQITTAPSPKRILPGSAYSDEMITDVALSKYCDLIPIERYSAIAARSGVRGLPSNSLINLTHGLAKFVMGAYLRLKSEVLAARVLNADETPHKMLEGDEKSNWFLWGFSTLKSCYFEAHDTRSGNIVSAFLQMACCLFLMSDVYSGYTKGVREANEYRRRIGLPEILSLYCNAHSRRKFRESLNNFKDESDYFLEKYQKIYELDSQGQEDLSLLPENRKKMQLIFEEMRLKAMSLLNSVSSKSVLAKALGYFLNNYEGLTRFTENVDLPIDNNSQERLLRNPVIGRKTWYGTHSKQGAETMAILFSLVESCKLNKVNPREYFAHLIEAKHQGREDFTPSEYFALTRKF